MQKPHKINAIDKLANIYLIIIISGFLFVSILPKLIGLADSSFSILYRVIVLLFGVFILVKTLLSKKIYLINTSPFLLFFTFWFIYSIRIIYDLLYKEINIYIENSVSDYLQFAFGVVLIPTLAIVFLNFKNLNYDFVLKWIYTILFISMFFAIFTRGEEVTGRDVGELNIGVLLFGQFGTSLCLLSIFLFVKNRVNSTSAFYILGFILGFISIFISASKSPFLALLIITLIFFAVHLGKLKFFFVLGVLGILFYYYFIDIMMYLNSHFNSVFLDRLLFTIDMAGDETRVKLIGIGFNEFLNNPLFGNAMLIQERGYAGSFPHNLIAEAFMATGFFGGIVFLIYIIKCIKVSLKLIKYKFEIAWISLLFLQFVIFGMFSGNLFSSNLFWISSLLLLGASITMTKINKRHL